MKPLQRHAAAKTFHHLAKSEVTNCRCNGLACFAARTDLPSGLHSVNPIRLLSRQVLRRPHGAHDSRPFIGTLNNQVTDTMRPGQLFSSFHRADLFINRLTSPVGNRMVHTPEYKVTAVRVDKLPD